MNSIRIVVTWKNNTIIECLIIIIHLESAVDYLVWWWSFGELPPSRSSKVVWNGKSIFCHLCLAIPCLLLPTQSFLISFNFFLEFFLFHLFPFFRLSMGKMFKNANIRKQNKKMSLCYCITAVLVVGFGVDPTIRKANHFKITTIFITNTLLC